MSLIIEETSFFHLRKFRALWAVSVRLHILGNEVKSAQNASHCIQSTFLFWCYRE